MTPTIEEINQMELDTQSRTSTSPLRAAAVGAVVALIANLVIWLVGAAAGAGYDVTPGGGQTIQVGALAVTLSTIIPFVIGGGAVLAARRWPRAPRTLAWAGLAVALLSLITPITAQTDSTTRLALSLMHVLAGVVWWASIRRAAR